MKKCCTCKLEKDESEFSKIKLAPFKYRLHSCCKKCNSKSAIESKIRRMSPQQLKDYEYHKEYNKNWDKIHPEYAKRMSHESYLRFKDRARVTKQLAIEQLGGKCSKCGFSGHWAALDFHHTDPSKKIDGVGNMIWKNRTRINDKDLQEELKKCIILCKNCHAIEHNSDLESVLG